MDGWDVVIARAVPFVVWSFVAASAPKAVGQENRYRRLLVVRLVWGFTALLLLGSLVQVHLIPSGLAVLAYTAWDALVAIVGVALLWVYWERVE